MSCFVRLINEFPAMLADLTYTTDNKYLNFDMTTKNSKIIQATREKVYNAFTDKNALEYWLAPNNMTGKIHNFDLKVGSGYSMSLFYHDSETVGKTSDNEDRFSAKFVELKPYEKIVQSINFQSAKNEFTNGMTMEVFLEEIENNSTKVTIVFKNIPTGIDHKDNETGTEQSLEKLARYLSANKSPPPKKHCRKQQICIGGVSCFVDSFVVTENSVFKMNICAEMPAQSKSAKRS